MPAVQKINTFLWFDNNAEEAIHFSVPSSRIPSWSAFSAMEKPDPDPKEPSSARLSNSKASNFLR